MNEPIPDEAIDRRINQRAVGALGSVPTWLGVMSCVVGPLVGGGVLYAQIDNTTQLAEKNERRLDQRAADDLNIAVQLATIRTDLAYIKEKLR